MSYLVTEVTRTDASGVETAITDWERITIRKGLDQKANTVTITLSNPMTRTPEGQTNSFHKWVNDEGELIWEENDAISIKAKLVTQQTTLGDTDLLTLADALEFNGKLEGGRTSLLIKGVDKTFALLNQQVARAFTLTDAKTPGEIIQEIIRFASQDVEGTGTFEVTATLQNESTYTAQKNSATPGIQTKRIDDSDFPIIAIGKVYKPIYEWIEDLSTIEATNDFNGRDPSITDDTEENPTQNRKMRYFVDKDNNFRWFYPDDDVDYTITIGSVTSDEDDVKSYNLTKSTFDVVNFVIYNGGQDLYGAGTLNYFFDDTTTSKKLLTKYKAYTEVASIIIQDEIRAGNLVENTSGTFTFQGNRYNRNGTVTPDFSQSSVSTDDDYNTAVRNEIDKRCKSRAREFTASRGSPRWKGDLTIRGRNFLAGELISLTSYIHGINGENLRIVDLTHNITKSGWATTLNLEEDEKPVGTVQS